jgi:hypothetical protein
VDSISGLRAFAILFILFTLGFSASVSGIKASDVEDGIVAAYKAVLEAEEAGADVSALLERLNVAGEYWALALVCLRTGDVECTAGNTELSVEALDGLVEDAEVLREEATRKSVEHMWIALGGSIGGVVAVVCGGWLGWKWFKQRYHRRALAMKPEVVEAES